MAVESNDTNLNSLLSMVETGILQLPDFQRSWVWDDYKICKLIESISSGFPMGAAMFLQCNGNNLNFAHRALEGVDEAVSNRNPDFLVLDGQQRLTTLFQVFQSKKPVKTRTVTNKDKYIYRYYYIDINKALNSADRLEAIISLPDHRILTENIGRDIKLDLHTRELEYKEMMFPLNIVFDQIEIGNWMIGLSQHEGIEKLTQFQQFQQQILQPIQQYKIPVIKLSNDTSKEAVCQIFENVNTGGIPLTVFELVTAMFASQGCKLREEWEKIQREFKNFKHTDILKEVNATSFLTALTLLSTYRKSLKPILTDERPVTTSCKRKDILRLDLQDFIDCRDYIIEGFKKAATFLLHQGIYTSRDLPYTSQLIPLAAIHAYAAEIKIDLHFEKYRSILSQWYWCGVFGELYGSGNETRYVSDIVDVVKQLKGGNIIPDTVSRFSFHASRLFSMRTRNSAAYKGIMALILQDQPLDFMSCNKMDMASYLDENTDIHHIFPQSFCEKCGYPKNIYDCVVNKTPIYSGTNRSIGGRAPSEYLTTAGKRISEETMVKAVTSHKIDYNLLASDNFFEFILDRTAKLCDRIELATGKKVSGRDSEEIIKVFNQGILSTPNQLSNQTKTPNRKTKLKNVLEITSPSGEVWCELFAYQTFIRFIEDVGVHKIDKLKIEVKPGVPLISQQPIADAGSKISDCRLYVSTGIANVEKVEIVHTICTLLNLDYSAQISIVEI